jgi:hypothetical protein
MIIEADNYEFVLEYYLIEAQKDALILDYFNNKKKLNLTNDTNSQDLFNDEVSVVVIDSIDSNNVEIYNQGMFWVNKLSSEDKRIIKKNSLQSITIKKISKTLLPKLEQELRFKSNLKEFTSYHEIIEEEYLFSLGGGYRKEQHFEPLLFMYSINDLGKFYKKASDDELQLILSLIFSKALKANNEKLARNIMQADKMIKTSKGRLNAKNIFGINIFQ